MQINTSLLEKIRGTHKTMYLALGGAAAAYQLAPPPRFCMDQSHAVTAHPEEIQLTMQVWRSASACVRIIKPAQEPPAQHAGCFARYTRIEITTLLVTRAFNVPEVLVC